MYGRKIPDTIIRSTNRRRKGYYCQGEVCLAFQSWFGFLLNTTQHTLFQCSSSFYQASSSFSTTCQCPNLQMASVAHKLFQRAAETPNDPVWQVKGTNGQWKVSSRSETRDATKLLINSLILSENNINLISCCAHKHNLHLFCRPRPGGNMQRLQSMLEELSLAWVCRSRIKCASWLPQDLYFFPPPPQTTIGSSNGLVSVLYNFSF